MSDSFSPIKERLRAYSASKLQAETLDQMKKEQSSQQIEEDKMSNGQESTHSQQGESASNMERLEGMIVTLTTEVSGIQNDVTTLMNSKSSVITLESELTKERDSLQNYKQEQEASTFKVKLLSAIVIRQNQKIEELCSQVERFQKDAKRWNLFIDGLIPKQVQEVQKDRVQLVNDFFKNKMGIESKIPIKQDYRVGGKEPKTVKVVLATPKDKQVIFTNVSNLKGKRNARRKLFFINDHLLAKEQEIKNYYRDLQKKTTKGRKTSCKSVSGKEDC